MRLDEIKEKLASLDLSDLYGDTERGRARLTRLVDAFRAKYGERDNAMLLSAPGRSEICGNHTDHNMGVAIAAAIDRDMITVAAPRSDGVIRVQSEGRREDELTVRSASSPRNFPRYKSVALIAGVVGGFMKRGYRVGGFDAYTMTEVLSGSGLSSSAAFEVSIGNALNHLYNGGRIDNKEIARIAKYAENVYFGKPSGLLDQMASAHGGFVYIDFGSAEATVKPIDFSLDAAGYRLAIVGPLGSHANLNEDYASIPREMKAVAAALGKKYMRDVDKASLIEAMPRLRETLSDRALMRAMHFISECDRVREMHKALEAGDMEKVVRLHRESGHSSFEYLQNVYTTKHKEQGLSLAIALTDDYIGGAMASVRVHGGGFAGTVQALIPSALTEGYVAMIESVFGKGSCMIMSVRRAGAVRII